MIPAFPSLPAHLGTVADHQTLRGGDIATTWVATTTAGRRLVVKVTPYDANLEVEGLNALSAAGAPVPTVHHVERRLLVMDHVTGSSDFATLGGRLAEVHDPARAPDGAAGFGWYRDNLLGTVAQINDRTGAWPEFFVQHRLLPHLDEPGLPAGLAQRMRQACDGPVQQLLDHDVVPSLVHGDLWPGNVVDGSWLVDPAVHLADAEVDLAAAALFGGLPPAFEAGYHAARPLDPGWPQRRPVLQLPHLLAHVRMFGPAWVNPVTSRLDEQGW